MVWCYWAALCLPAVSQAPQHCIFSEMKATRDGCFANQSVCSVISLDRSVYRTVHEPLYTLRADIKQSRLHMRVWTSQSRCFTFLWQAPWFSENGNMCVLVVTPHDHPWQRMWNCSAASGFKPGVQYPPVRLNEDMSVTATKRQQSIFLIGYCTDIRVLFETGLNVCHKKDTT